MVSTVVHVPVLLDEAVSLLSPDNETSTMIDGTIGEGGHAGYFLSKFPGLFLIGIDQDLKILEKARERLKPYKRRIQLINGRFSHVFSNYNSYADRKPDIIFLDLGISRYHFEESGLGFSFLRDEPLDMRLDRNLKLNASYIVNNFNEKELVKIFFDYGEERFARRIAGRITAARRDKKITTSGELAEIVRRSVPPAYRHRRIHPATKIFQALRIAVNGELEELKEGLLPACSILQPGGRIGIISFHSLEDRIVKHFYKEMAGNSLNSPEMPNSQSRGEFKIITKKPVRPGEAEVQRNPASRSALFRVMRKIK
ncbi:MAG: 16S rRNA (cytosine(1402)-N(4))-methyltransferase RsmH [Spirochaetes bacterium]|nr:16S rRNA (cytosine(1402)-N(4))-methyltransferase RsmH [Spirochaetota bacterium]